MDSCSLFVRSARGELFEIIISANGLRRRRVLCTKPRFHFSQQLARLHFSGPQPRSRWEFMLYLSSALA